MSKLAKTLQAAAGNAGGDNLYVEDVFSTYLYTGIGTPLGIKNNIALGDFGVGTSTYLDGSSWLTTATGLTGAVDSKTFTVSFWVNTTNPSASSAIAFSAGGNRFLVYCAAGYIRVFGRNSAGSTILDIRSPFNILPQNAWAHVLVSCDMASTSLRRIYLNDVNQSITSTTYTNAELNFSNADRWGIGTFNNSSVYAVPQNLAHVYFDTAYRDLSVEANRRYFIDANGGSTSPSTLTALNPILYVPMTEDYSIGENLGTGGDFTTNGSPTIVQSGTQYEAGYGQGGMVWLKNRPNGLGPMLFDTERGATKYLESNGANDQFTAADTLTSFNADGFSLSTSILVNGSAYGNYVGWTFRKAPKFFTIVTYTGNGSTQTIPHDLGGAVGCMFVKAYSGASSSWFVWHRGFATPASQRVQLQQTNAVFTDTGVWNNTSPTSTDFYVGAGGGNRANDSGVQYIAYLFAHDAGGFGDDGTENIISCGSYTGNGSANGPEIDLGFEPQWVMIKRTNDSASWLMLDIMRGISTNGNDHYLLANSNNAENSGSDFLSVTPTGFKLTENQTLSNLSGSTYIYIAIRRGPMKTPESGTEVFSPVAYSGNATTSTGQLLNVGFPVDFFLHRYNRSGSSAYEVGSRLQGISSNSSFTTKYMASNTTASEAEGSNLFNADNTTIKTYGFAGSVQMADWFFRRAPGFMDVVAYTGTGVAHTEAHNLGVAPELMIVKRRDGTSTWPAWHKDLPTPTQSFLFLDSTQARLSSVFIWDNTYPALESSFVAGGFNVSGATYIAYLFASCPGVSKVGSYTGTAADINVDCGFTTGARFVLIKRTDPGSTGDWYVWDSARGIVAGNDPYLILNYTAAEVTSTDYIDPLASGFTVTSSAPAALNASGGSYIFLAIA